MKLWHLPTWFLFVALLLVQLTPQKLLLHQIEMFGANATADIAIENRVYFNNSTLAGNT
jgi:hypothetical protein